jgi:fluoroacetyl-CoA thioesterase
MPDYRIGATHQEIVVVGNENAIKFLGPEGPRVLSTPQMILNMERACRLLILPMLDEGFDTVGTHVNVSHQAAAPMGSTVAFHAELLAINNRRAEFRVSAQMGATIIGEGTHQRAIIHIRQFGEKVRQNNESATPSV